jgi:hypothetical protein
MVPRLHIPGRPKCERAGDCYSAGDSGSADQLNGNLLREYLWQASVAEKSASKEAFVEGVRQSRNIVMRWVGDGGEGQCVLGPNTQETRATAAEYQAAAHKKGFHVRFSLV